MKKRVYFAAVLSLVLVFAALAVAKSDNANSNAGTKAKNNKVEKTTESQKKVKVTKTTLKTFEKADKAAGKTNAAVHEEKTQAVIRNLARVATQEESAGNTQVSNQVKQVVQTQAQIQAQTTDAIEEIENRNKIKTFLLGVDYKNLGQLRSSLVQNRNQIRTLTRTMAQVQNEGDQTMLQEQLATLMQERQRMRDIIASNESGFSIFGWVAKIMLGYEPTPINQTEEEQLTQEVEDAINNVPSDTQETTDTTDTTLPVGTGTTAP